MGGSFSVFTLKAKSSACVKRMQMQTNKKNTTVKLERKQIGQLIADGKDESARIRTEALFHELDMIRAMEVLQLMVELILARTKLIETSTVIPHDLEEAAASIIYCSRRIDVAELKDIAQQLALKFGKEWAMSHIENQSGRVNPVILAKTSVQPPAFDAILAYMKDVAAQFGIDWDPHFDQNGDSGPNALGSIAAIGDEKLPPAYDGAPPEHVYQKGTLNISVYEARNLYHAQVFGKQDPYVMVSLNADRQKGFKTKVYEQSGVNVKFQSEHFPFHIPESGRKLLVEAFNKNNVTSDDFIGRALLDVDKVIQTAGSKLWYRIGRDAGQVTNAGEILLSAQFMPLDGDGGGRKQLASPLGAPPQMLEDLKHAADVDAEPGMPAASPEEFGLPSVPAGLGQPAPPYQAQAPVAPAAPSKGGDDFDELEARFRALQ